MSRGRLIVFEGLDGVGKTTLSREVAAQLDARWTTTPDPSARELRAVVDTTWSPEARHLFYAGSVLAAGESAQAVLARGQDVVIDRYWLSTWVYATVARTRLDLAPLERLVRPADLTVFVDLPEDERRARLGSRDMSAADESSVHDADDLLRHYLASLARPCAGRAIVLDGSGRSTSELADEVRSAILGHAPTTTGTRGRTGAVTCPTSRGSPQAGARTG